MFRIIYSVIASICGTLLFAAAVPELVATFAPTMVTDTIMLQIFYQTFGAWMPALFFDVASSTAHWFSWLVALILSVALWSNITSRQEALRVARAHRKESETLEFVLRRLLSSTHNDALDLHGQNLDMIARLEGAHESLPGLKSRLETLRTTLTQADEARAKIIALSTANTQLQAQLEAVAEDPTGEYETVADLLEAIENALDDIDLDDIKDNARTYQQLNERVRNIKTTVAAHIDIDQKVRELDAQVTALTRACEKMYYPFGETGAHERSGEALEDCLYGIEDEIDELGYEDLINEIKRIPEIRANLMKIVTALREAVAVMPKE